MANGISNPNDQQVVIGEEISHVRLITLNRPRQLNVISPDVVSLLAYYFEKWEMDEDAELIIVKGNGRAFSAGGDLKVFYDRRKSKDACLEVVYRMYWLCYHLHTYKKTQVSLVNGISMGGGASLMVPMKFSVVTEKTIFSTPEASIGHHADCSFSYLHSRLPGYLGEFLALTSARLNGKELVAVGLATHFVASEKIGELEKRLIGLNSGKEERVKAVIEEFSEEAKVDDDSVLTKQAVIDKCFSKETVAEIIESFEAEAKKEGNEWIGPYLKGLKRSSPTGLKINLRSVREGREKSLAECLKQEFRLTINILRCLISGDIYEGIRAITIDKDSAPKWEPESLDKVDDRQVDLVFQPFKQELELQIPEKDECRWDGKYESSSYANSELTNGAA